MTRNKWALVVAVIVVAGMVAFAFTQGLRWGWPAVAVMVALGGKVYLNFSDTNARVFKRGARLRQRAGHSRDAGQ